MAKTPVKKSAKKTAVKRHVKKSTSVAKKPAKKAADTTKSATATPAVATKLYEIKSWLTGNVLFALECGSLKIAVEACVKAGVSLYGANLRSANLRYANLRSANLGYANLGSADLGYADLRSADLGSADLRSANLRSADLGSANLRSANLRSADLGSANLGYADLRSADLGSADLRSAKVIIGASRSDGYQFLLTCLNGEGWRIKAGCRNFTIDEATAHWAVAHHGTPLGQETQAILENLYALAAIRGFDLTTVPAELQETAT